MDDTTTAAGSAHDEASACAVSDGFSLYLWREAFGDRVEVVDPESFPELDPPLHLVRVADAPVPGYSLLATLSGSRFADADAREGDNMAGKPVPLRTEYVIIVRPEFTGAAEVALIRLLSAVIKNGHSIPEGATAPDLLPGVRTSSALLIPNLFGYALQPMDDRVLELLQVMPITPEEEEYVAELGYQLILDAIGARVIDSADLERRTIFQRNAEGRWESPFA